MNFKHFFALNVLLLTASIVHAGGMVSGMRGTRTRSIRYQIPTEARVVVIFAPTITHQSPGAEESEGAHPFGVSDLVSERSEHTQQLIAQLRAQLEEANRLLKEQQQAPAEPTQKPEAPK